MLKFNKKQLLYIIICGYAITSSYADESNEQEKAFEQKIGKSHNLFFHNPLEELHKEIKQNSQSLFTQQNKAQEYQSVRDLYYISLNYSPTLKSNIANLQISYAKQLTADSVLYPTISANYALTRSQDDNVAAYNQNVFSLSVLQYLYNAEGFARANQTKIQIDSSKISLESARQQLIMDTAKRWTEALLAKNNTELSAIELQSSKKLLDKAQQSFATGLGKKLDVAQAEAAYKLAFATQIQRQSNYTVALQNLENLTGIKIQTIPTWQKQKIQNDKPYSTQLKNNKNIQRQIKTLESSILEVNAARGKFYPNISLRLAYNNTEHTETKDNKPTRDPVLITLQLEWELFSGFRTEASLDEAYAKAIQQKAQLTSLVLQQKAQLSNIIALLQADEQRIPAIEQQVSAAKIAYDTLLQGYELGTENLPDVLNAQKDYQQAQLTLSQSTYQHWINYLNFKFITGQISPTDLPN